MLSKSPAYRRRNRILDKIRSGVPLPMFAREGEGYSKADLDRNIKIGNVLHLRDLRREKKELTS
jgi:hypothetical protein